MDIKLDKKKRFEMPELEIVEFTNGDIITTSSFGNPDEKEGDVFHGWW